MAAAGEAAALIDNGGIGGILVGRSENLVPPAAGAPLRLPAEEGGGAVIPPDLIVIRHAIDDGMAEARHREGASAEIGEILDSEPCRQHAGILRLREAGADAQRQAFLAEFVEVKTGEALAKHLRDPVKGIRSGRGAGIDPFIPPVEADDMVGTGEDDAGAPVMAGTFEEVISAEDIGLQDGIKGLFDRDAAEMQDAVDAFDQPADSIAVG